MKIVIDSQVFEFPFSRGQTHRPGGVSPVTNVSFFTLAFSLFLSQAFSRLLKIDGCKLPSDNG